MSDQNIPQDIKLHTQSKNLTLTYVTADSQEENYILSCEYLRVHSPSAEVKGHGPGQEVLQTGKVNVNITDIQAVGNYAIQLYFDDGHDSGIFSWDYLYELCQQQPQKWQDYLKRLTDAGASRDPEVQTIRIGN
jgi:DUF971 family protein